MTAVNRFTRPLPVRDLPRSLFELSMELLAVFEADGRFGQVNAARWSELLGWREDELIGHQFAEFVHPEDLAGTAETARQAFAEGTPTRGFANRYRTKAGAYRWLLWESRELHDGRWLAAARDITREREMLRERDALRRVATRVAGATSPTAIFAAVAEEVGRLMDADAVGVTKLLDECRLQVAGVWVRDREPVFSPGQVLRVRGASLLDRFLAGGVIRHPEREAERDTLAGLRRYGSSVTVPVWVHGEEWGRITAFHLSRASAREDSEPRLAEFAALTAMAVANADAREQLQQRALTDALTSLMNRGAFFERLAAEIARARRHERPLTVAVLDIDHFKQLNDRYGHRAGDRILRELGRAIIDGRRLGDVVGRIGGDELAVALPDCDADGAVTAIDRLRDDIAAPGHAPAVSFSAGVCELAPADSVDDVIARADEMLYQSKRHGRARTSVAAR